MMKGKNFDAAFKQEAVKKVLEQGKGVSVVAEELGIHIKTMYRWLKEYKPGGDNVFPDKEKVNYYDEEVRRLKRKIEDVKRKMNSKKK